jgi:hypothetical protein
VLALTDGVFAIKITLLVLDIHGSLTFFTADLRPAAPGPEGPGWDDGPIKDDEAKMVRG